MNLRKSFTVRSVHRWVAIVLAIPFVVMAVSGILIGMRSVMQTKVPLSWVASEDVPNQLPVMAYLEALDGSTWIGNAQGLSQVVPGQVKAIPEFSGQEVVGLAQLSNQPWPIVATRMAVWFRSADGNWTAVKRGRVRQLSRLSDGRVLAIAGGRGEFADGKPWVTADGIRWDLHKPAIMANSQLPPLQDPKVALHQFMRSVHSGAFFVGKGPGEMVWSNVMGWILIGLCLTGGLLWYKRPRKRSHVTH